MMSNAISRRIEDLEKLSPPLTAKADLESYWKHNMQQFADKPFNATKTLIKTPLVGMDTYKVEYEGFDSTRIHGWYLLPHSRQTERIPCVVHYHGYTGSKGYPEDYAAYLLMGIAVFSIDIRGQNGETGNLLDQSHGMVKGWITQGILNRDTCYYKAITIDAIKALEWVSEQPEIDPTRICVSGGSQGGGLAMIAAALSDRPAIAVAHIPNMCYMDYGVLNSSSALSEAAAFIERFPDYLEPVLTALSYYDNMNLAHLINIPIMVTVGLKDLTTMPETIYAAYNRITSEKIIYPYPFTGHAVLGDQKRKAMEFIAARLLA